MAAADRSDRIGQREQHEAERERGRDHPCGDAAAVQLEAERQGGRPDAKEDEDGRPQ
jgi:hypothetical protein